VIQSVSIFPGFPLNLFSPIKKKKLAIPLNPNLSFLKKKKKKTGATLLHLWSTLKEYERVKIKLPLY